MLYLEDEAVIQSVGAILLQLTDVISNVRELMRLTPCPLA